ncbi:MAG: hypothetical protein OEU98_06950 [Actinomycetota bacterium]|nr:hypothetical protein [Actinomycetota bacterium]
MTPGRPLSRGAVATVVLGLVVLALIQVSVLDFVPTPWAVPDLVVVAVLALAIARGPLVGGLVGAWAGLILDLIPPAAGPLGGWMLVLAVAGAVLGRVAESYRPGPVAAMLLLSATAGGTVALRAAVVWFAGSPAPGTILGSAVGGALWALLLAPLALLLVSRPARKVENVAVRLPAGEGSDPRSGVGVQ